jgi:hypothetical protein
MSLPSGPRQNEGWLASKVVMRDFSQARERSPLPFPVFALQQGKDLDIKEAIVQKEAFS